MNPEEKRLLEETARLSQENNILLRRIRRSLSFSNTMSFLYYALIIGVPIALYYFFLQPYLGQAFEYYKQIQSGTGVSTDLTQNPAIQKLLENFGAKQ